MSQNSESSLGSLGFVTVRAHSSHGYFGGYLLINYRARPLEFHCTLPIKPTRAQSVLYGSTLDDFVCGEQIARALVTKTKSTPDLILTDTLSVLSLRRVFQLPVVCVKIDLAEPDSDLLHPVSCSNSMDLETLDVGDLKLVFLKEFADDHRIIVERCAALPSSLDLKEPFGRIRDALLETHPSAKAA